MNSVLLGYNDILNNVYKTHDKHIQLIKLALPSLFLKGKPGLKPGLKPSELNLQKYGGSQYD